MLQLPIAEADEVRNSQTGEIVTNSFPKAALYQTLWKVYNAVHLGASVSLLVPELSGWLNRIINSLRLAVGVSQVVSNNCDGLTDGLTDCLACWLSQSPMLFW